MNSWLNTLPNPTKYQSLFKKDGIVTIPNFLNPTIAGEIYGYMSMQMPADWWYISSLSETNQKIIHSLAEIDSEKEGEIKRDANKQFNNNRFSYVFYRTYENHYKGCVCMECKLRQYFSQPIFIQYMSRLLGIPLNKMNELFLSKYDKDCFLTTHNDNGNGKIAWVLNMTAHWQPQWGGHFVLLDQNRQTIKRTVVPQFNSLTVFRIPEKIGVPHYVSHVVVDKQNRFAVSGWFS